MRLRKIASILLCWFEIFLVRIAFSSQSHLRAFFGLDLARFTITVELPEALGVQNAIIPSSAGFLLICRGSSQ